jgi:hypothetical protein
MTNFKMYSDEELFRRCKISGKEALQARQIFGGLLPEVYKRRLYEKKGFDSIYEFAAKLAGLSHDQVDTFIRLERKYEDMPVLHSALLEAKISVNKLVRIASIATTENQSELFEAAQKLSKTAIDVFVKDYKLSRADARAGRVGFAGLAGAAVCADFASRADARAGRVGFAGLAGAAVCADFASRADARAGRANDEIEKQNGLFANEIDQKSLPVQGLKLDEDVMSDLMEMQKKGIDVNAFLRKCLDQRHQEIKIEKEQLAREAEDMQLEKDIIGIPASRYIPAKIRKLITEEHGSQCSRTVEGIACNRPADHIHHENRFSEAQIHDPRFLKPLCKGHHELEHANDQKYRQYRLAATI